MNFATFIDFLNCLYINEVEDATRTNNQERIATMVFEGSFEGDASADPMVAESNRRQAQRWVNNTFDLFLATQILLAPI